jgi:hypothetical protein
MTPCPLRSLAITGLFSLCTITAGCTSVQVVAADSAPLQPKQGLLVMQIKSNASARLNYVDYKSDYSIADKLSHEFIGSKGFVLANARQKQYIVMPMDAGDYAWMDSWIAGKSARMDAKSKFTIVANAITYIGQFDIVADDTRYSMRVVDQADDMRRYLGDAYPGYLKSMPMVKQLAAIH